MHQLFIDWAEGQVEDPRLRKLFLRMAERIGDRASLVGAAAGAGRAAAQSSRAASIMATLPTTARADAGLCRGGAEAGAGGDRASSREQVALDGVTHLVVASCTGFVAPGIDQIIARRLGLDNVERTLVGFMGCYAAVSALRTAHHIVRSEPEARVLAVTVELCSLHLQQTQAARTPARHAPVQRRRRRGPGDERAGRARDEPSLLDARSRIRPS